MNISKRNNLRSHGSSFSKPMTFNVKPSSRGRIKSALHRNKDNETMRGTNIKTLKAETIFNEDLENLKNEMIDQDRAVNLFHTLKQFKRDGGVMRDNSPKYKSDDSVN